MTQPSAVTKGHLPSTNTAFNLIFWPEKLIPRGANIPLTGRPRTTLLNKAVIDAPPPDSLTGTVISLSTLLACDVDGPLRQDKLMARWMGHTVNYSKDTLLIYVSIEFVWSMVPKGF